MQVYYSHYQEYNRPKDDISKDEIEIRKWIGSSPFCYIGSKFTLCNGYPQLHIANLAKHTVTLT